MNYKILIFILSILTVFNACKDTNSSTSEEKGDLKTSDSLMQKNNHTKSEPRTVQIYTWVNKLRIRAQPDTKSDIIAELSEGEALTYLGEKTDFTQKINMRGSVQDEPWLKVQTKTGEIGWVFGGGVKFYSPKVDVNPSPYQSCFRALTKNNRYPAFKHCIDQVSLKQLKKDKRYVKKQGNGLIFTLLSGKKKELTWSPLAQEEADAGYHYRYYIPEMGFFVVELRGGENSGYRLVNDKSGNETPLWGFPKVSPDAKHLMVASAEPVPIFESHGLRMYGYAEDGFQVIYEEELEGLQPVQVKWIDLKTVEITFRPTAPNSDGRIRVGQLQQQAKGTWKLSLNT